MNQSDLSGLDWRKSSHSTSNGNCVEVARDGDKFWVRNSNDRQAR
jgi:hypothetical protein